MASLGLPATPTRSFTPPNLRSPAKVLETPFQQREVLTTVPGDEERVGVLGAGTAGASHLEAPAVPAAVGPVREFRGAGARVGRSWN